ncbi:tail fiber assembly protein [Aeromonas rivipollensis]
MVMFFSAKERGFYTDKSVKPADAVEIDYKYYIELLERQHQGMEIMPDKNGRPISSAPSVDISTVAQRELSNRLVSADYQINMLKPAVDGGYAKAVDVELLAQWQRYRYELPDVRSQPGWPEQPTWPPRPGDPATE